MSDNRNYPSWVLNGLQVGIVWYDFERSFGMVNLGYTYLEYDQNLQVRERIIKKIY